MKIKIFVLLSALSFVGALYVVHLAPQPITDPAAFLPIAILVILAVASFCMATTRFTNGGDTTEQISSILLATRKTGIAVIFTGGVLLVAFGTAYITLWLNCCDSLIGILGAIFAIPVAIVPILVTTFLIWLGFRLLCVSAECIRDNRIARHAE